MRNYNLDKVDAIMILLVVILHATGFIYTQGEATFANYYWYRSILNLAVPTFFAITGVTLANRPKDYIKIYIAKNFKLFVFVTIFFFGVSIIQQVASALLRGVAVLPQVMSFLSDKVHPENFISGKIGYYHLWYMWALILGLLAFNFLKQSVKKDKYILIVSFILYLITIVFRAKGMGSFFFNEGGFPKALFYVVIGYMLGNERLRVKHAKWVLLVGVLFISTTSYLLYRWGPKELLLVLPVAAIIHLIVWYPGHESKLSQLGARYSTIYIFHALFLDTYQSAVTYWPFLDFGHDILRVLFAVIISVAGSLFLGDLVNKLLKKDFF